MAKSKTKKAQSAKLSKPAVKAKAKASVKVKAKAKPNSAKAQPKKVVTAKGATSKSPKKIIAKAKTPIVKKTSQQSISTKTKPTIPSRAKSNPTKATIPTAVTDSKNKKSESYFKSYLKPLDDRMVVLVNEMEKMTAGGLYIPDTVTDVSGNYHGKVMAIGRGHMNKKGKVRPLDVSVGDKIVFSQFSGSQIDMDGNNIMVIRESDVLGIVK